MRDLFFKFKQRSLYKIYLEFRIQKTRDFLRKNELYEKNKIHFLIECLKRRAVAPEKEIFSTAAVISFLGFFIFDIYKKFLDINVVDPRSSQKVFFNSVTIAVQLLGIWFVLKPFCQLAVKNFFLTPEVEAEKALKVLENIYLDFTNAI